MKALKIRLSLSRSDFKLEVDETIPLEGVTVLFGESGSGKTTLLRCIAGLEKAEGEVLLGSDVWQANNDFKPVWKRNLAYVFQEHSLLDHLTAKQNIEYGLKRMSIPPTAEEFDAVIGVLGLGQRINRYPNQLSGGERQRVAIARAVLKKPALLLMDEPLAALDQARKSEILPYLEILKSKFKVPILYVTHSLDELSRLGDRVLRMQAGKPVQSGTVVEVLSSPEFPIPVFEEPGVIIDGVVKEHDEEWNLTLLDFQDGLLWLRKLDKNEGEKVRIRLLAKDIGLALQEPSDTSILNNMSGMVEALEEDPAMGLVLVHVQIGGTKMLSRMSQKSATKLNLTPNSRVWVLVKTGAIL